MGEPKSTLDLPFPLKEKIEELSPWHSLQNPGLGKGFTEKEKRVWWKSNEYQYKIGTIRAVDLDTIITIYSETFDMSKKQRIKNSSSEHKAAPEKLREKNIEKIMGNTGMNISSDELLIEGSLDTAKTATEFENLYLGWIPSTLDSKEADIKKKTMKTLFRFVFGKKSINDKNKAERFYSHLRFAYTQFEPEEKIPCKGNSVAEDFRKSLEYRLEGVKKEISAAIQTGFPKEGIFVRNLFILEKGLIKMLNYLESRSGCFEYGEYSGNAKRSEEGDTDDEAFTRALMVAQQLVDAEDSANSTEISLKKKFGERTTKTAAKILEEIKNSLAKHVSGDDLTGLLAASNAEVERLQAELAATPTQELAAAKEALATARAERDALKSNDPSKLKKTILVLMFSLIRSRRAFELLSAQMDESEQNELERIMREVDEKIESIPEETRPLVRGIFNFLTEKPFEGDPIEMLKNLMKRKGDAEKIIEFANTLENPLRQAAVTSVEEGIESIQQVMKDISKKMEDKVAELNTRLRGLRESLALKDDADVRDELARVKASLTRATAELDECNKIRNKQEVDIAVLQSEINRLVPEGKRGEIDKRLLEFEKALEVSSVDDIKERIITENKGFQEALALAAANVAEAEKAAEEASVKAEEASAKAEQETSALEREADAKAATASALEKEAIAKAEAATALEKESLAKAEAVAALEKEALAKAEATTALEKEALAKAEAASEVAAAKGETVAAKAEAEAAKAEADAAKAAEEAARSEADAAKASQEAAKADAEAAKAAEEAAKSDAEAARNEAEASKEAARSEVEDAKAEAAAAKALEEAAKAEAAAARAAEEAARSEATMAKYNVATAKENEAEARASVTAIDLILKKLQKDASEKEEEMARIIRDKDIQIGEQGGTLLRGVQAVAEADRLRANLESAVSDKEEALKKKNSIEEELAKVKWELAYKMLLPGMVDDQEEEEGIPPKMPKRGLGVFLGASTTPFYKNPLKGISTPTVYKKPLEEIPVELDLKIKELEGKLRQSNASLDDAARKLKEQAALSGVEISAAVARSEKAQATLISVEESLRKAEAAEQRAQLAEQRALLAEQRASIGEESTVDYELIKKQNRELKLILHKALQDIQIKEGIPEEKRIDFLGMQHESFFELARDRFKAFTDKYGIIDDRVKAALAIIDAIEPHIIDKQNPVRKIEKVLRNIEEAEEVAAPPPLEEEEEVAPAPPLEEEEEEVVAPAPPLEEEEEVVAPAPPLEEEKEKEVTPKFEQISKSGDPTLIAVFNKSKKNPRAIKEFNETLKNYIQNKGIFILQLILSNNIMKIKPNRYGTYTRAKASKPGLDITIEDIKENILKYLNYGKYFVLEKLSRGTEDDIRVIENLLKGLLTGNKISNEIDVIIKTQLASSKAFLTEIKGSLIEEITRLINKLLDILPHSAQTTQSGGALKSNHLCDLMLSSILLKLEGSSYKTLIDKAGKTLDDIGQCDLILDMLNQLVDEYCLIKKTNGYTFSSVYMDFDQARALVTAFNKNFTDEEKQKFYSISSGIFNYKIPDEHQTLLGKHPFFLVGTPSPFGETPLYGVIDDEITLTLEERSVLEEDGIPIGAIMFLYIICLRECQGHESHLPRPNRRP